jgi:hypothetical protein
MKISKKYKPMIYVLFGFFLTFIFYILIASYIDPEGIFPGGLDPIIQQDGQIKDEFIKQKTDIDILVLGSSRSEYFSDSIFNYCVRCVKK